MTLRNHKHTITTVVTITAGVGAFAYGVLADGRIDGSDFRQMGMLIFLLSLVPAWRRAMRTTPACAYELGFKDGKEQGRAEGRRVARPVVIPAHACECSRRLDLAGSSTAQE